MVSTTEYVTHRLDIAKNIDQFLPQFDKILRTYVMFNLGYLALGVTEVVLLALFFTFLVHSSLLAISLALLFLTCFSYFIIKGYLQTLKQEQFKTLRDRFVASCEELLGFNENVPEHYLAIASACSRFATELSGNEYKYYRLPRWLEKISPSIENWSCWWHWQDVFQMREILLQMCVSKHLKMVKLEPTSLEVHGALANAYVMLSSLYVDPRKGENNDRWVPPNKYTQSFEEKYRTAAEKAIEEFKILKAYAPDDPWVHEQLAYSYHDLGMPAEEIREYEKVLALKPNDKETLYKLGVLYFGQGLNAKGLRIYEVLQRSHYVKAEQLIEYYGEK